MNSHSSNTINRPSISRFGSSSLSTVAASAVSSLPGPIGSLLSVISSSLLPSHNQLNDANSLHLINTPDSSQHTLRHTTSLNQLNPGPTQMQLSTICNSCGDRVFVEVPGWMTDAMNNNRYMEGSISRNEMEEEYGRRSSSWRGTIVAGVISIANYIKTSQIPPLVATCVKSLIVFILYLDRLFFLHQRFAVVFSILLEGLVEIEKEVGLFRSLGEGLSVFWEAFIKGTIALAKSEPTTQHQSQHQHHQHASGTTSPYYTSYRPASPPQTASSSSTNLHSLNFTSHNSNNHQHPHSHSYPYQHQPYEGPSPDSPPFQSTPLNSAANSSSFQSNSKHTHTSTTPKHNILRRAATPSLPLLLAKSSSSHLIPHSSGVPTSHSTGSLGSVSTAHNIHTGGIKSFLTPPTPSSTPIRGSPPPPDYAFVTRSPLTSGKTSTTIDLTGSNNFSSNSTSVGLGVGGGNRRGSVVKRRTRSEEYRNLVEGSNSLDEEDLMAQFEGEEHLEVDVGSKGWGGRIAGAVGRGLGR